MAFCHEMKTSRVLLGSMEHGSDLLEELTSFCSLESVTLGWISGLGAVSRAVFAFYDQATKTYREKTVEKPMEILNLTGNVSLKDGKPFVHIHATFEDGNGSVCGGHLQKGTRIFACEFLVTVYEGLPLVREPDEVTGLALWKKT
jgi:uncharacterized protein